VVSRRRRPTAAGQASEVVADSAAAGAGSGAAAEASAVVDEVEVAAAAAVAVGGGDPSNQRWVRKPEMDSCGI
jgi:hypothetical protein